MGGTLGVGIFSPFRVGNAEGRAATLVGFVASSESLASAVLASASAEGFAVALVSAAGAAVV